MLKLLSVSKESPYHTLILAIWHLVVAVPILCCGFNLWVEINDSLNKPETKIDYLFPSEVFMPVISIRPFTRQQDMLNPIKVRNALHNGSLSQEYIDAVNAGLGAFYSKFYLRVYKEHEKAYDEALRHYGSIIKARMELHNQYGISCQALFKSCGNTARPFNCCEIFELVWGLRGPYFALKPNSVRMNDVSIRLKVEINMKVNIDGLNMTEVGDPEQSYFINIGDGLDQSLLLPDGFHLERGDDTLVGIRVRRRILDQYNHECTENPKLKYFLNYTVKNCLWERGVLERFGLCNISCQLPILELINPNYTVTNPCSLAITNEFYFDCRLFGKNATQCSEFCFNDPNCTPQLKCYEPCNQTEFQTSIVKSRINAMTSPELATFQVKFETFEVQVVQHTPRFLDSPRLAVVDMIGVLGGILGLWLDSAISLLKVIKNIISKVWELLMQKRRRKMASDIESNLQVMKVNGSTQTSNEVIMIDVEETRDV